MDGGRKAANRVAGCGWEGDAGGNLQRKRDHAAKVFERGGVDKKREKLEEENRKLKEAVGELTLELKKTTGEAAKAEESRGEREAARGNSRTHRDDFVAKHLGRPRPRSP